MELNPYLSFDGRCEAAFKFYEKALGGKIVAMVTYGETPMKDQSPVDQHGKIAHARLTAGDKVLMGGDAPPGRYEPAKGITVMLGVDQPAAAERVFKALSEGGTVQMPIEETFWAQRSACSSPVRHPVDGQLRKGCLIAAFAMFPLPEAGRGPKRSERRLRPAGSPLAGVSCWLQRSERQDP